MIENNECNWRWLKFKKIIGMLIIITIMFTFTIYETNAESNISIEFRGKEAVFTDAKPFKNSDGIIMAPIRNLFDLTRPNSLSTAKITYDKKAKSVTIKGEKLSFILKVGENKVIRKKGSKTSEGTLLSNVILKDNRVYVPACDMGIIYGVTLFAHIRDNNKIVYSYEE